MPQEIFLPYGVTGLTTLYAAIRRPSDGYYWYTVTPAWEIYNAAHVAAGYAIPLTEEGVSGDYYASFPVGITLAGRYDIVARKQAGASPAWPTDSIIGTQTGFPWSGSSVSIPAVVDSAGRSTLTPAEHTAISGTDVPTAMTTQGYTSARAVKVDNLDASVNAVLTQATNVNTSIAAAQTNVTVVADGANSTNVFTVSGVTAVPASLVGMSVEFSGGSAGNLKARKTIISSVVNGANVQVTVGNAFGVIPAVGDTAAIF